jgi:hypothetical protein
MSPGHIRAKAEKYRALIVPMFVNSSLHASKGIDVHIKHSTLRDLLALLAAVAEPTGANREEPCK